MNVQNKVSLFGPGFVGKWIYITFPDKYIVHPRGSLLPTTNKILWPISTVHNYNVQTDPHLDIDVNLSLLISELEEARKKFGKDFEFNFISSWFVYGKVDLPAREDAHCEPTGFYSITKRTAEQLLISYCQYYGISWRILRLANVLGAGDKKISTKKNAIQFMIQELAQGRSIKLYRGTFLRDLIDVRDVARAIDLVLEKSAPNDIYNIGNGIGYPVQDVIEYVSKSLTGNHQVRLMDAPEFHKQVQAKDMYLDISKIKKLGYKPQHDILETLQWLVGHYKYEQSPDS